MNLKNIILSVALILGSCSDLRLVAQPTNEQSELIKKAKDTLDEFKKTLKCVFRKKGCDEKKRKEIIVKGLKILAVVAVLTTGAIWKFKPLSPAAAKKAYGLINNSFEPTRAAKKSREIGSWLLEKREKEKREMTYEEVLLRVYNTKYETKRKEADEKYRNSEFQEAHQLIKEAEKAFRNAKKLYEKELEKARIQALRRGKGEEE